MTISFFRITPITSRAIIRHVATLAFAAMGTMFYITDALSATDEQIHSAAWMWVGETNSKSSLAKAETAAIMRNSASLHTLVDEIVKKPDLLPALTSFADAMKRLNEYSLALKSGQKIAPPTEYAAFPQRRYIATLGKKTIERRAEILENLLRTSSPEQCARVAEGLLSNHEWHKYTTNDFMVIAAFDHVDLPKERSEYIAMTVDTFLADEHSKLATQNDESGPSQNAVLNAFYRSSELLTPQETHSRETLDEHSPEGMCELAKSTYRAALQMGKNEVYMGANLRETLLDTLAR